MSWRIIDNHTGKGVESHPTPKAAQRALMIHSAQEVKNGCVADFRIEPQIFIPCTIDELKLPTWVLEVLELEEDNS